MKTTLMTAALLAVTTSAALADSGIAVNDAQIDLFNSGDIILENEQLKDEIETLKGANAYLKSQMQRAYALADVETQNSLKLATAYNKLENDYEWRGERIEKLNGDIEYRNKKIVKLTRRADQRGARLEAVQAAYNTESAIQGTGRQHQQRTSSFSAKKGGLTYTRQVTDYTVFGQSADSSLTKFSIRHKDTAKFNAWMDNVTLKVYNKGFDDGYKTGFQDGWDSAMDTVAKAESGK